MFTTVKRVNKSYITLIFRSALSLLPQYLLLEIQLRNYYQTSYNGISY